MRHRFRLFGALVLLWLCWGTSFPAMRVLVATLPPLLATGAVFAGAGALLLLARPTALGGLSGRQLRTAAGTGLCLLGAQGLVAVAEQHVYAGTAALTVAVVPLWVVLLRHPLGDRLSLATGCRLLVGFGGVSAVLVAGGGSFGWSPWTLLVLVAAAGWAVGTVWASSRAAQLPGPWATVVVQLLAGGFALLGAGVGIGEVGEFGRTAAAAPSVAAFWYLLLVDSLAGFALYGWLLRTAPVGLVSSYAYAVPVVAYLVGVLVLGEPFRPLVLVGAAAIVASVAAQTRAAVGPAAASRHPCELGIPRRSGRMAAQGGPAVVLVSGVSRPVGTGRQGPRSAAAAVRRS